MTDTPPFMPTTRRTTPTEFHDFVMVFALNGQIYIGRTSDPLGAACLTLTDFVNLASDDRGRFSIAPPIFPASQMLVRPSVVIALSHLKNYDAISKSLREYFIHITTGIVVAKG